MSKVNKTDGCWEWTGSFSRGYGRFALTHRSEIKAHRLSHILFIGEIPDGMFVCHKCDNKKCVNPDHLFAGTPKDNAQDMIKKGRKPSQKGSCHYQSKLTDEDVRAIISMNKKRYFEQRELAKHFGVSPATINYILSGKRWNHLHKEV